MSRKEHDDPDWASDESEIVSVCGVNPRCDICGKAQQPDDDWNDETGNHRICELTYVRAWVAGAQHG
jgi:hypothetical protein